MAPGQGFTVEAPGSALVDFNGTFTTGPMSVGSLNRTSAADGWHLLGNPYPAPLDWSTMTIGSGNANNLQHMDGAVYVFQSSGPYAGTYRTYLATAPGANSPLIPAGSGFFVRTATAGTPGTVRFTDANRITVKDVQPAFGRFNDRRPALALALAGTANPDVLTVYADPAATPGFDGAYDAAKLANPGGLNLAAIAPAGNVLAIDARPAFTAGLTIPLRVEAATAGTYALTATVANLPAGLTAYLRDAANGQQTNLHAQSRISLTLAAGLSTRFSQVFAPAGALATADGLTAAQVVLFPNPATIGAGVSVALPVAVGTSAASATLLNALGQTLRTLNLPVRDRQASSTLPTTGLAAGVYTLRLITGNASVSKRLVVE